jgi:hypothetical protein
MLQVLKPEPGTRKNSTEKSEAQSNPSGIQAAARRDFWEDSMKRVFLLIVVPALLLALGFAQSPAASGNTDQINIKGCLGGFDDNYTVAEDNSGKIFKIATSSADLKAHLGQDVNLIGHKASAAENSLAVTEVNMISEQCTAVAAAPPASVSTSSETIPAPPASAAPAASVSTPLETVPAPPAAAAPAATVGPSSETSSIPAAIAAAPAPAPDVPAETASARAAGATVHRTQSSARSRKSASNPAAVAATAEPASTPVADAVPTAHVGPSSETATTPAAPPAAATKASTSRSAGILVSIVVVVLLIGAGVPLYNRWRRRKLLDQTRGQNLSFTKDAKSEPGKKDTTGGRKAA